MTRHGRNTCVRHNTGETTRRGRGTPVGCTYQIKPTHPLPYQTLLWVALIRSSQRTRSHIKQRPAWSGGCQMV
eukprot:358690-Chlamydomonas_euryale.AAC.2